MMERPIRLLGYVPKFEKKPVPWMPCDWLLTIDLDGRASVYFEFWKQRFFQREASAALTQRALETLTADYSLNYDASEIPRAHLPYAYGATYWNDHLTPACETLLQLGVRSRMHLFFEHATRLCSFAVATERPAIHVLRQYFRATRPLRPEAFRRLAEGRHIAPKQLVRFTLPQLPGLTQPMAMPVQIPATPASSPAIQLGTYISPYGHAAGPAAIPLERLNLHAFITGTTGSGKTNTIMRIVEQAHPHLKGVLVLDFKEDQRALTKTVGAKVHRFPGFTHNLLKPEGPANSWPKEFAEILSQVISRHIPASGTADVVAIELDALFRHRGVYDGSTNYPHLGDLLAALEERDREGGSRERNWVASGLRVLRTQSIGETRDAFHVREGLSLEGLLQGVHVLELRSLGNAAAADLLASVLLRKIRHILAKRDSSMFQNLVVIDEAQHVLARGQEATSILNETCREIRSYGAGLVLATQSPSAFSRDAVANSNTIIAHRVFEPDDVSYVARLVGLDDDSKKLLRNLRVGHALLRGDELSLVRVKEVQRPKIRDDELSRNIPNRVEVATSVSQRAEVANRVFDFTEPEWMVFEALAESRAINTSTLKELLRRDGTEIGPALTRLLDAGLVGFVPAKRSGPGRSPMVWFLRPYGEEAYRRRTGHFADRRPLKQIDHKATVAKIAAELGLARKPDTRFDFLYEENGVERAIEVETGSNNNEGLLKNLVKSIELQGEGLFVVSDSATYNRVLQVAAKRAFDTRAVVALKLVLESELKTPVPWHVFTLKGQDSPTP